MSTLSGILLLGNSDSPEDVAEGASLIGIEPATYKQYSIDELITSAYTALVQNVVQELNKFLTQFDNYYEAPSAEQHEDPNEIVSVVTIVEGVKSHKKHTSQCL